MIKAILWDIDGTILNFTKPESIAIKKCFELMDMGICTDEMVNTYSRINVKWWEKLERGEYTKKEILVGRFREFFEFYGLDTSKAAVFNDLYQVRLGDVIVFNPNAEQTVRKYRGRIFQAIVTNGTLIAQKKKLKASDLENIVDRIYISEEIGFEKPNAEFFAKAFEDLKGLNRDEIIIVGDSLTSDIKGGNNVGIRTCWYNPEHKTAPSDYRIDYEISDLSQLDSILEKESLT